MLPISRLFPAGMVLLLSTSVFSTSIFAQETIATLDKANLSYAIGFQIGTGLRTQSEDLSLDVEQVIRAIRDTHNGAEPTVPEEEMLRILQVVNDEIQQKGIDEFRVLAEENQASSNAFLANNRGKDGIVELPSGVQYRVIESGEGSRPGATETVTVHYRGSKMDGLEFDSSFARGTPQTCTVDKLLQGWQEILPLMREGATWQIFVPPEMAFGIRGQNPVGPNEVVIFDLKLVQIGTPADNG